MEAIWAPSQAAPRPHIIGDLFAQRVRFSLGEGWAAYVQRALTIYYHKTLAIANDPAFRQLIADLIATYTV